MTPLPRLLALGSVTLLFAAAAPAADIPKPPDGYSKARYVVDRLRSGSERVAGDEVSSADATRNRAALKTYAQYLAYSIAQPPYNGDPVPKDDKTPRRPDASMATLMEEAARYADLPIGSGNQGRPTQSQYEYGAEFGAAIAPEAQLVWTNSAKPIERVNAVRLMAITAQLPAPALIDPLLAVVNNPRVSDAEKLYAFQGLKNLLDQVGLDATGGPMPDRHFPALHRDQAKLAEIAHALTNYITAKRTVRDDKDRAVIEYVRRHAVEALAEFKEGVLRRPNKEVLARPAWTLARVMEQDPSVSPSFTIHEMTLAATGFCEMKMDPELNLDVAAFTVAKVVALFAQAANLDAERAGRDGTLPSAHWKVLAARLSYALSAWREQAKPLPAARHKETVIGLATDAIFVLTPLEKEGAGARPEVNRLVTWAQNNPPKAWAQMQAALLFRDDPNSVLPFAATSTLKTPAAADPKKGATPPKK